MSPQTELNQQLPVLPTTTTKKKIATSSAASTEQKIEVKMILLSRKLKQRKKLVKMMQKDYLELKKLTPRQNTKKLFNDRKELVKLIENWS